MLDKVGGHVKAEAFLCANLCDLIQSHHDIDGIEREFRKRFSDYDYRHGEFIIVKNTEVMVLVIHNTIYVVWRGTEPDEMADVLDDMDIRKRKVPEMEGAVHNGFWRYFSRAYQEVLEAIKHVESRAPTELFDLVVTGHSLGAAAATYFNKLQDCEQCYLFGSPRTGDSEFACNYLQPVHRFSILGDPVTSVPTFFRWRHIGTVHLMDKKGVRWHMMPRNRVFVTARNLIFAFLQRRLIKAISSSPALHGIDKYIERLKT